jgi:hypothetical protein
MCHDGVSLLRAGPATARELYDGKKTGTPCRSIADIKAQNAADTTYADDFLEKWAFLP